ncbi:MAG: hypothetical protein COA94_00730 [Rickettsiales bacterium]|nr:MAG: hypothetical protein COA94_00730 [Rickettsiales bacterium]
MKNRPNIRIKQLSFWNVWLWMAYLVIRCRVYVGEFKRPLFREYSSLDLGADHFVLLKGNKVIGIARIIYKQEMVEFGRIAIRPSSRGQGYGKTFIDLLISEVKDRDKVRIISLFAADHRLVKFYRHFDFLENGEVYFGMLPFMNMIKFL